MDNSIVVEVAEVLFAMMCGKVPQESQRQRMIQYFSRFASFPQGAVITHSELSASQSLLATEFGERWSPVFKRAGPLSEELAEGFVREYLQSQFGLNRNHSSLEASIYCGETVTESHNILDHVTQHSGGGEQWILHLTTEGECLMGGVQSQLVKAGQLVMIAPDYVCEYQRAPGCPRWVHRWLRFTPLPEWRSWSPQLRESSQLAVIALNDAMVETAYQSFVDVLLLSGQGVDEALLRNRIEYLLLLASQSEGVSSELDERIRRGVDYVAEYFCDDWSVDDLAGYCHLSTARFAALFKEQLGVSPVQWRDQLRMREARKQLSLGSESIAHIASRLGYNDPLHFSRRFRQLVGISPRAYRAEQS